MPAWLPVAPAQLIFVGRRDPGQGGEAATVTDADIALGRIDTNHFAGGKLAPTSNDYCEVYIKEGGFTYLR